MPIGIITNLNSRKNRKGTFRADRLARFVANDGVARQTRRLAEVRAVIEEFVDRGCRYWVSDGGDGTLHWMMNIGRDVLEARGLWTGDRPFPVLVPTNGGTIDFVARKAGIVGGPDAVIRELIETVRAGRDVPTTELDTVEVVGHRPGDPDDAPSFRRIGFAAAIGGVGQRFFSKYYESKNPNHWTILEVAVKAAIGLVGSAGPLRRLPIVPESVREYAGELLAGTQAVVTADGREFPEQRFQGLHVSALDIDFVTMRLFPYAKAPGKLHMAVGTMSALEVAYKWTWLVAGKPIQARNWAEFPGERMDVEARGGELLDPIVDGEMFYGMDRVSVRLGPKVSVLALAGRGPGF